VRETENNQCPGKDKLKRKCLSCRRKAARVWHSVTSRGKLFHSLDPAAVGYKKVIIIVITMSMLMALSWWIQPLHEFTRFIWRIQIQRQAALIHSRHRHLLLLLSSKADTRFTVRQRVGSWVDLGTALRLCSPYPRLCLCVPVDVVINATDLGGIQSRNLSHCSYACNQWPTETYTGTNTNSKTEHQCFFLDTSTCRYARLKAWVVPCWNKFLKKFKTF